MFVPLQFPAVSHPQGEVPSVGDLGKISRQYVIEANVDTNF